MARALWIAGRRAEAAGHLKDMLRLNPGDNQGVRYPLLAWLIELADTKASKALLRRYKTDWSAFWLFGRALAAFQEAGVGEAADALLAKALAYNPHVAPYLLGRKPLPKAEPPYYSPGEASEAVVYVQEGGASWRGVKGALDWLGGKAGGPGTKANPRGT